jgi:hypothetical protein
MGKRATVVAVCGTLLMAGCAVPPKEAKTPMPVVMTAQYTPMPVKVDGVLDDAVWQRAPVYPLSLSKEQVASGLTLAEPGEVRLAWDENYLYVAVKFSDSDIVAEGEDDQLHHYKMGDLAELFLKPEDETWYWELYATPRGKKTSFWFPGRGRLGLDSGWNYQCGLRVAAKCEGTLNDWRDKDSHWTAEMAMPIKDLTARGEKFSPGSKWRILVSRYNYSRYLPNKELTMSPQLPKGNFHLYEEYAVLDLTK